MRKYEYFSIITKGSLLGDEPSEIDMDATRLSRDKIILDRVKMLAEILRSGMMDHHRVADELGKLVAEARQLSIDMGWDK
jgi:hypothetical protein